jgi:DNA-binding transcriptional MocR family regulator
MDTYGSDALAYGASAGPGPVIGWIQERLQAIDLGAPRLDSIVLSAGSSQGLDHIATLLTAPGDVVLVEAPTYHLALRILKDHAVETVAIATDASGLVLRDLKATLSLLRRQGRNVRLLYTIPTFHNPTGRCLANDRRQQLVDLAADDGLLIVEDDVYRELAYDGPAPPSLWSLALPGTVARLGSFSKSLAPGLRSGFITSDPTLTDRIRQSGMLDSGGGISHFSSLVVAEFADCGDYNRHVERLRKAYAERRDALLAALSRHLEGKARWTHPSGGYFVWLELTLPIDATAILSHVHAHGTSYLPGSICYLDQARGHNALRLAFSRYSPEELSEGVRRLAQAIGDAV